ncbi:MAG: methyltransferase domain-containing protein [Janthinobacterium lividum]
MSATTVAVDTAGRLPYFEAMYSDNADPYGMRTRWYEARKRAVLLAALPHPRYANAYEPGCGAGELSVELASRCDALLSSDFSPKALASARTRTAALANVRVASHALPHDWPGTAGPFDLIVISEIGYFLDADAMRRVAECCNASLGADGVLVACNWRPDFDARVLPTDEVHAALASIGLARTVRHAEDDFLLEVWCRDPRSVAQREGIR